MNLAQLTLIVSAIGTSGNLVIAQSTTELDAAKLFYDREYQRAFEVSIAGLQSAPSDSQLQYIAGASACGLTKYDAGIEHLLLAIRSNSDGVKFEHREALEKCIASKYREPTSTTGQPGNPPRTEFPAGLSFTASRDCEQASGTRTAGFKFLTDGSVEYAMSGCRSYKFLRGAWALTATVISMEFLDKDESGKNIRVAISGVVGSSGGKNTITFHNAFEPTTVP